MDDVLRIVRTYWLLIAGTLISGLYLGFFWAHDPFARHLILDAHRYDGLAKSLLETGFRSDSPHHQAPLYPAFVAVVYSVFGPRPGAVFVIQSIVGAIVPWLVYRAARPSVGEGGARIAGAFALVHGALVAFAPRLLPTVPSIAAQLGLLLVLSAASIGPRRALGGGVLLGINALLRPNLLLLLPWVVVATLRRSIAPKSALLLIAAAIAVIAPATIHNARTGGGLVPIAANGGETFYHGNNPRAAGTYSLMAGLDSADILKQSEVATGIAEREAGRSLNASGVSRHWLSKGLSFWRDEPGRALWLLGQKARLLLGADETPVIYSPAFEAERYLPPARALALAMWIRLPLEVLLLIPAGSGLAALRNPRAVRRAAWVAGGAVAVVTIGLHVVGVQGTADARGIILSNLGTSQARGGDHRAAAASFRDATELSPDSARAHHYLGRALAFDDRLVESIPAFQRAAALRPGDADVLADLAAALLTLGDRDAARAELTRAAAIPVARASWHTRAATLWHGLGDVERAVFHHREAARIEPRNPRPWNAWVRYLSAVGQCEEAARVLDTAEAQIGTEAMKPGRDTVDACR
jgi:Flp pilus assembly protein TadD